MAFLKPQNPMTKGSDYFYPLTTADQVIMDGGYRLNDIVGKVKKSTITLYANGWSAEAPYYYSVTVDGLSDKVNMKMLPHYPDDFEGKQAMKEETVKISFASRNGNILTFECWEEVPTIDIPVDIEIDITYPSKGAEVELNYSVVGGTNEPKEPTENMIWVNTDVEISNHIISKNEPSNPLEGMVWISAGDNSNVAFHSMKIGDTYTDEVYPISAKQYVSGAWVDKEAKSYQGGEWVLWWNGELFNNGNKWESVTGGFGAYPYGNKGTGSTPKTPTVTFNDDSITMSLSNSGSAGIIGSLWVENAIDLTKWNKLCINVTNRTLSGSGVIAFTVTDKKANGYTEEALTKITGTGVFEIPVASFDNFYNINVVFGGLVGNASLTFDKLWLE